LHYGVQTALYRSASVEAPSHTLLVKVLGALGFDIGNLEICEQPRLSVKLPQQSVTDVTPDIAIMSKRTAHRWCEVLITEVRAHDDDDDMSKLSNSHHPVEAQKSLHK
jgi:hypothetical protein